MKITFFMITYYLKTLLKEISQKEITLFSAIHYKRNSNSFKHKTS